MISTNVRSRQSSWRNGSVWLKSIENECVCSEVVTSEIVLAWFGFGGKTRPTVERQKGKRQNGSRGPRNVGVGMGTGMGMGIILMDIMYHQVEKRKRKRKRKKFAQILQKE